MIQIQVWYRLVRFGIVPWRFKLAKCKNRGKNIKKAICEL